MRLHDKLVQDIEDLETRRDAVKAKAANFFEKEEKERKLSWSG